MIKISGQSQGQLHFYYGSRYLKEDQLPFIQVFKTNCAHPLCIRGADCKSASF